VALMLSPSFADNWGSGGPSEIDGNVLNDTGLNSSEVESIVENYNIAVKAAQTALLHVHTYNWQLVGTVEQIVAA
jgi:hypothetical protein